LTHQRFEVFSVRPEHRHRAKAGSGYWDWSPVRFISHRNWPGFEM